MKETVLMKEVWVPSESPFRFVEKVDPKTGEKRYVLSGLMLPFNKISRNSVMYNVDSVKAKHKLLVGKPLMYNHKVDTDMLPKGHFIDSWCEEDGWHYKADVDPAERDLIRKLERGDLRHVSIQLIGGKVVERVNENNETFTEAWVDDIIEGSIVPAPGFLDTTATFAEALHPKPLLEQRGQGRGLGSGRGLYPGAGSGIGARAKQFLIDKGIAPDEVVAMTPDEAIAKAKEIGWELEFAIGDKVVVSDTGEEGEIVDILEGEPVFLVQLAEGIKRFMKEDITTTTGKGAMAPAKIVKKKDEESVKIAEEILENLKEEELINILKEFKYKVGDVVRIPYGISGVAVAKYVGQVGMIIGEDEKTYNILFQDGKKLKVEKDLIDISVAE